MESLQELKKELLADGIIDAEEVKVLHEKIYADGVVDKDEADFLFEINDAVSGKNNDEGWQKLFVDAITSFLLDDEKSPGVIDESELAWLIQKIGNDGKVDGAEKALLNNLKDKAKVFPDELKSLL